MSVRELWQKASLYGRAVGSYWRADSTGAAGKPEGPYPLDLIPRLRTGHFDRFDAGGIPLKRGVHNYTTICAYGLAHWALHARAPRDADLAIVLRCADYLARTACIEGSAVILRTEIAGRGHVGAPCGMVQGEAMSLLSRAHLGSGEAKYRELALGCLEPFERAVEDGGVLGTIGPDRDAWFEEDTALPLRHILNGMIYAVWGLADVAALTGSSQAGDACASGVRSLVRNAARFDLGWWSLYDVPDVGRAYVASMMYHDLHVTQLRITAALAGGAALGDVAARFARYAASPINRLRAGGALAWGKATKSRARNGLSQASASSSQRSSTISRHNK